MSIFHRPLPTRPGAPFALGRNVHHDLQSSRYAVSALPRAALSSVAWPLEIPTLDQGQLGSCVPNTGTERLASNDANGPGLTHVTISVDAAGRQSYKAFAPGDYPLDEDFAIRLYAVCTRCDAVSGSYPPDDTGSSGLGLAKALVLLGLAQPTYQHAFSLDAVQAAAQSGPVALGLPWYESMFTVAADGHLQVDMRTGLAGGHEILLSRMSLEDGVIWFRNHWGDSWGVADPGGSGSMGWAYMTFPELSALLKAQGDATVIVPVKQAAPVPPQPQPAPGPGVSAAERALDTALRATDVAAAAWRAEVGIAA